MCKKFFTFIFAPIKGTNRVYMNQEKMVCRAEKLFNKHGYKTVTMDDVAMDLGISKKTLYECFSGKEKLIEKVMSHRFAKIEQLIEEMQVQNLNPVEEMLMIRYRLAERFENEWKSSAIYQLKKYYMQTYSDSFYTHRKLIKSKIESNMKRGIEQKYYREGLDENKITEILMICQHAIKSDDNLEEVGEYDAPKKYCDINFDIFMRGILTHYGLGTYIKLKEKLN